MVQPAVHAEYSPQHRHWDCLGAPRQKAGAADYSQPGEGDDRSQTAAPGGVFPGRAAAVKDQLVKKTLLQGV